MKNWVATIMMFWFFIIMFFTFNNTFMLFLVGFGVFIIFFCIYASSRAFSSSTQKLSTPLLNRFWLFLLNISWLLFFMCPSRVKLYGFGVLVAYEQGAYAHQEPLWLNSTIQNHNSAQVSFFHSTHVLLLS